MLENSDKKHYAKIIHSTKFQSFPKNWCNFHIDQSKARLVKRQLKMLRLPYTFESVPNEISNVKKKSLKKTKYWQRNGDFTFWPELKITRLIDMFSAVFSHQFISLEADTVKS